MLASGVRWAVTHKVEVISISRVITSNDLLLHQQIEAALIADIVVVAAAGNYPKDDRVRYPAAIPGVVAVAGVDRNGNRSKHSVTGPEVLIAAPSDDISSTGLNGTYTIASGTSNATAIVAGAVALVRARYPELKATEVVRRLTATAIDKGPPGRDDEYGYGVLNLVGALTAELPSATTAGTHPTASPTPTHPRPPYPEPARFPWWLTAVLPLTAAGIAAWLWVRLRRERRPR